MIDQGTCTPFAPIDSPSLGESLAKQVKGAMTVELRAWDTWQVEGIGCHVRDVGVADRLLAAIDGASIAGTVNAGAEAIQIAPGGNAGTPSHEGNPVILKLAGGVMRRAAPRGLR